MFSEKICNIHFFQIRVECNRRANARAIYFTHRRIEVGGKRFCGCCI